MIIDVILDRYDGDAYDPKEFYASMMAYEEGTDYPISRAMDSGEEEDIRRELCAYIDDSNYNPKIKDFINSVAWLESDDGKDYSKEMDILGESKKHTCSMSKKKENLAKKKEANSEEYITEWQADIIKGLEKVKDKYGLVIEYNGPFSDKWKEYPTYSVSVRKGGKKEDIGTVGTDYVHAFVDYTNPGMNVSSPHKAKDYSAEEAIQVILNSAKMCLGKKGESKKHTCSMQKKIESLKKNEGVDDDAEQMLAELQGIVNKYFRGGKNITIRLNCTPTQDWVELDNNGYTDRVLVGGTANAFVARDVINKIINKYYL